jgi:hypothetical protein
VPLRSRGGHPDFHSMDGYGTSLTQVGHQPECPLHNQRPPFTPNHHLSTWISSNLLCAYDGHLSDARIPARPILIRATTVLRPPPPDEITVPRSNRAYSAISISAKGPVLWYPVPRVSMRVGSAAVSVSFAILPPGLRAGCPWPSVSPGAAPREHAAFRIRYA